MFFMDQMLLDIKEGFICAWRHDMKVDPIHVNTHWIHLKVDQLGTQSTFITGIYGPPKLVERHILWDFIISIGQNMSLDAYWRLQPGLKLRR